MGRFIRISSTEERKYIPMTCASRSTSVDLDM